MVKFLLGLVVGGATIYIIIISNPSIVITEKVQTLDSVKIDTLRPNVDIVPRMAPSTSSNDITRNTTLTPVKKH